MCTQIKIQTIYFTDKLPDLPEVFPETSASNKRIYNDTSFDASDSLFSTMDASAVIKLNPPRKKNRILSSSSSEDSEDQITMHPIDSNSFQDDISNIGSPLNSSTPINEYDMAETEVLTEDTVHQQFSSVAANPPETSPEPAPVTSAPTHPAVSPQLSRKFL